MTECLLAASVLIVHTAWEYGKEGKLVLHEERWQQSLD